MSATAGAAARSSSPASHAAPRARPHSSIRRVTERVAPNVGTNTECFPAPPATTIMMSDHSRAIGARRLRRPVLEAGGMDHREALDVGGIEARERHLGPLPQRALEVVLAPAPARHRGRVLGSQDHERLAAQVDVVAPHRGHATRHRGEDALGRRRAVIVDVVRGLGAADRHRADLAREAPLDRERLPGRRGLVLGHAVAVLARVALRGAVLAAGPRAAHVLQHEAQGAPDHRVGAMPLPQRVAAAVDAEPERERAVDDHERRAGMRGGLDRLQVERGLAHRLDRGEDHRQVLGQRARQHRVHRHPLHGGAAEPRRQHRDRVARRAPRCPRASRPPAPGWRESRAARRPSPAPSARPGSRADRRGPDGGPPRPPRRRRPPPPTATVPMSAACTWSTAAVALRATSSSAMPADGVRHRHDAERGHALGAGLGQRERAELVRAQDDGRDPPPFQLRGVVDTPRRARPSVGGGGEDGPAVGRHLVEDGAGGADGGAGLAPHPHLGGAELRPRARGPRLPAGRARWAWSCRGRR